MTRRIEDPWEFEHSQVRLGRHEHLFVEWATERGHRVPTCRVVCPQCDGSGASSLYLGVISQETFAEDPDFYYDYMDGQYDRRCESCSGRNVVEVVDVDAMPDWMRDEYIEWMESGYETDAIHRQERMMGA